MSMSRIFTKSLSNNNFSNVPRFGLMFDIDGVILRGPKVLPTAPKAFEKLTDINGKFKIPTVFVTNAGNCLRQAKADKLSTSLGIEVTEDHVVMSHSPLKMFKEFHNKHILAVGQGPVVEIAKNLGFRSVTTIDEYKKAFPSLDAVDQDRRKSAVGKDDPNFTRIEAIVIFGEPVRWETPLQLIIDALLTSGLPSIPPLGIPQPHIPILACNSDLQWMADAIIPRFGNGAFLLCLESLYKKITGQKLVYSALVGKPSEITYKHSELILQKQAELIFGDSYAGPLRNIYFVGDNVCTDIFGANLYDNYLINKKQRRTDFDHGNKSRSIDCVFGNDVSTGAENCYSILVETGVYSGKDDHNVTLKHSPRDFLPANESLKNPTEIAPNVLKAVEAVFEKEDFI